VLRSLARDSYFEADTGHFGLACREYSHFTSPIRRYPDLHNHRRVREWVRGTPSAAWDPVALTELAALCSANEQNATDAEREGTRVKGLRALRDLERLRVVSPGSARGFFDWTICRSRVRRVALYPMTTYARRKPVAHDGRRTSSPVVLSDAVNVVVARVDVPARECELALEVARPTGRRRGRRRG
jgi:ribonuclease R